MTQEAGFLPEFGGGGTAPDIPISMVNGKLVVLNYTPTNIDPGTTYPTEPISIIVPAIPTEEIIFEPVIEVVAPPTAMFDSVSSTGYNVQFVNESIGSITTYVWDFGDGATSTAENPSHHYTSAGSFLVNLTVSNFGQIDNYSTYVESIAPTPEASFDFAIGGYSVYLTNRSNTMSWLWDFGDGQTSTEKHPKHTYATTGTYTVSLTTDGLVVTKSVQIDVEILLEWQDNSSAEDGFKIERSPDGSTDWVEIADIETPNITSYGVTKAKDGVDSNEMNFFRVLAYASGGDSDPSNTANVRCN